jgi:signal transduction histidine kinase
MISSIKGRIRNQMLLAYLIPIGLLLGGLSFFAYYRTQLSLDQEFSRRLLSVAGAVVLGTDPESFLILSPGDEKSQVYQRLGGFCRKVKELNGVERIALFDRKGKIVADTGGSRIGDPFSRFELDREVLGRIAPARGQVSILFSGPDRRLYKEAYAPVLMKNPTGGEDIIGYVAVEGSAVFFAGLTSLRRDLLLGGLLGLIIVAGISLLLARRIVNPVRRLVESAGRIGAGDLDSPIEVREQGEIGFLAATLERMRGSMRERDRTLNLMLRGVAHEVRNPLGGMELFAGLLSEKLGSREPEAEYLEKIRREIGNLKKVVQEFLDYARPEELRRQEVKLSRFFAEVMEIQTPGARERGVELETRVDQEASFKFDPGKLRRAVINLVENAVSASERGEKVLIQAELEKNQLRITIADRGIGIPEADRPHLFEPFFTTRESGSGIGLALSKKVVDGHGGRIEVKSREGEGTTVEIWIPGEMK